MIFNIFSDPLAPESNTVGIYSYTWMASKLFVNKDTLKNKIKELELRGVDISFPSVGNSPRIYNDISKEMVAIAYPDFCKKYWTGKWKNFEDIEKNQSKLFGEIVDKAKKAKAIAKKRMK